MVKYILELGADINLQGFGHPNALQLSARKGYKPVVEFLLEHQASWTSDGGEGYALCHTILGEQFEFAELLLERGADPNIGQMNQALKQRPAICQLHYSAQQCKAAPRLQISSSLMERM